MIILAFIFGVDITLFALIIFALYKGKQPKNTQLKNNVHFYVARDEDGELWLYLGKPIREEENFFKCKAGTCVICSEKQFKAFELNINDYKNLKWEDEPKEVFLNLKD